MTGTSEEAVAARARKVEAAPSKLEVDDHNLDHAVFRSWRPHCMKGRTEACGHWKSGGETGDAQTVNLDYMHTRSEQEKEGEEGVPNFAAKENKTTTAMAKVVPSKGAQEYAVEVVRKFVEQ